MNHKKKEDKEEGSLQVIIAILIAVAVLMVVFYPNPPKEVPQDVEIEHTPTPLVETAEAAEVVLIEVRKEVVPPSPHESFADKIIDCESSGRNIEIIDTNGEWSRGVAMFQDATWAWMSKAAGVEGSSLEPEKARQVLIWASEQGLVDDHWVICYGKVTGLY